MTIAYNLKDILTLDETCAELSERFNEEVSIARLFEFERVGNLTISLQSASPIPVSSTLFFQPGVRSVTEGMVEQLPASIYTTAIEQKERYGSDWRVILGGNGGKFAWVDYIGTTTIDDVELGVYLNKPKLPSYLELVITKKDLDAFIAKAQGSKAVDGGVNNEKNIARAKSKAEIEVRNVEIRRDQKDGMTNKQLQDKYSLRKSTISEIVNEKNNSTQPHSTSNLQSAIYNMGIKSSSK